MHLHLTQLVAFQGIEQANFLSVSRLDHPFPHICLVCHDLEEFFLIAIYVTFVSLLVLPLAEVGLLHHSLYLSRTLSQDLLRFSCDFCLGTGHPLQCKSRLLPLGFDREDLVPKAGISQLWSDWLPISSYKRSECTATAKYPLQTSDFSAGTTVAVWSCFVNFFG